MFKINLKIAWRNLLKYKGYSMVNVIGLSLGLAGFIFILLFINYEKSYDQWHPDLENVYQLQEFSDYSSNDKRAHLINEIDERLSKVARALPQVGVVTIVHRDNKKMGVTVPGKPAFLQENLRRSDSLFFQVFPFEFKYGNAETAFIKPESIVLKEDLARKYFGEVNPVGKVINIAGGAWNKEENLYTVTGVVKEPITPSVVKFDGMIYEGAYFFDLEKDYGSASEVYAKTVASIADMDSFNRVVQKAYLPLKDQLLKKEQKSVKQSAEEGNAPYLQFKKLSEVHQDPVDGKSWKETLKPILLLSMLLLLVSIINFVNLATAQAASRAKEVGVKKVIGARQTTLLFQFLAEAFIQCVVALFIALLVIEVVLPTLNQFFALKLVLFSGPLLLKLIPQLLAIVVVVGLLAGAYPAIFLTSYKVKDVLKGNFALGKQGAWIRKGLVVMQFVVAVSFIIAIIVINYQLAFLKQRDNGFTESGLINIRSYLVDGKYHQQLKNIDGVHYVGFSSAVIGDNMSNSQSFKYKNEVKEMHGLGLSIEGLQALDARLLAGRMFSAAVVSDTVNNAIINESAAKLFNENMVGQTIFANDTVAVNIIGVIKDIQVEGFENSVKPSIYYVQTEKYKGGVGGYHKQTTLIRFDKAKIKTVTAQIDKIFREMNAYYPASYTFVEDDLARVMIDHERFEHMVELFSILSLTLSLFGLFALAAFITKQRTKEIAVRKVLGAGNTAILVLLNKGYLWMVLLANLIAFPLTYILLKHWLDTFAYRITVTPLPFALACVASVLITIITVSLQARRAVHANPVKALKYE